MGRFTLYTYQNRDEFEKFYKQKEDDGYIINPFIFQETMELLEENPKSIIDISNLVEYLMVNNADIFSATYNFRPATEDTQFIIIQSLSDEALEMFRLFFKDKVPLYSIKSVQEQKFNELSIMKFPFKRVHLYSYRSSYELDRIIKYLNDKDILLVSFSQINDAFIADFKKNTRDQKEMFVDITSLVLAIKDNSSLNYYAEKIMIENTNLKIIIHTDQVKEALEVFRLVFDKVQPIYEIIPIEKEEVEVLEDKTVKIVDLSKDEVKRAIEEISNNLFGHKKFKDQLPSAINNFIFLNRIKEKKVFSIFLLGDTGLGKTEFASLLKNQLNPDTPLIKINFGNYSSQDALNSLIGSPRGYRGSEEGELSNKLLKSRAGVILCDEFEKANMQIFNFFLELLEDGVFTDSLSREHNLDGYIIIFTSNLDRNQFYKHIPKEFQSRLDLVFEFCPLSDSEKNDFVNYFVDNFIDKVEKSGESLGLDLSPQLIEQVKNTDVRDIGNIRDIKRVLISKILKGN